MNNLLNAHSLKTAFKAIALIAALIVLINLLN